jgi:Skp family chaperone for outer membrane proteins
MKNISALLALTAVLLSTLPARGIELSLEENRAERGSVGFVDMQRLFATSPDAQRAKENFQELVRQAEERVNLRKAELLKLRQQLDSARAERAALAASSATAPSPEPPAASTQAAAAPAPAVAASSTPAPSPRPAAMALPGMTAPDTATAAPPASSSATAPALDALLASGTTTAVAVSSPPASAAGMFPAPPAAAAAAPSAPAAPTLTQSLLDLDSRIIRLQSEVARSESELAQEHDEADQGLLDVESRRTDQVLARLYRALTTVARRNGVSVVVDKTTILYGHPAVDLTDKVLKYLQEAQP